MVDADEDGYLLQIFNQYKIDQPCFLKLFKDGIGLVGNFKALFESIEREQQLRGTL
jgi:4-hydroxyphenylpyruvate dioxygenase